MQGLLRSCACTTHICLLLILVSSGAPVCWVILQLLLLSVIPFQVRYLAPAKYLYYFSNFNLAIKKLSNENLGNKSIGNFFENFPKFENITVYFCNNGGDGNNVPPTYNK